jgi:hypothetical protein
MLSVSIQANVQPALRALGVAEHQQVPFATALMLTRLAQSAQEKARAELAGRFPDAVARGGRGLRWVSQGIRIEPATKANQQATVYDRDWFMFFQESGGEKRPIHSAFMAIPHGKMRRGAVPWRPSEALQQPRVFVGQFRNSWSFIGERIGAERYPFAVLYVLKPTVRVQPRLGLAETVHAVVSDSNIAREFNAAMQEAVRTSR